MFARGRRECQRVVLGGLREMYRGFVRTSPAKATGSEDVNDVGMGARGAGKTERVTRTAGEAGLGQKRATNCTHLL